MANQSYYKLTLRGGKKVEKETIIKGRKTIIQEINQEKLPDHNRGEIDGKNIVYPLL